MECDRLDGDRTHMPVDLDREGWLTRIERIGRFLGEMSSTRARIRHVDRLARGHEPLSLQGMGRFRLDPMGPLIPASSEGVLRRNGNLAGSDGTSAFP